MHSTFALCFAQFYTLYTCNCPVCVCQSEAKSRVDLWPRLPFLCIFLLAVRVWTEGAVTSQCRTHNGYCVLVPHHRCLLTPVDARQWEGLCGRSCCLVAVCHRMISGSDMMFVWITGHIVCHSLFTIRQYVLNMLVKRDESVTSFKPV